MGNQEWQRRMSAAMIELSSLIERAPKGEMWQFSTDLDVVTDNQLSGEKIYRGSGWRTVTIRYFVHPGLEEMPELKALSDIPLV